MKTTATITIAAALLALAGCSSAEPVEPPTETVTSTETATVEAEPATETAPVSSGDCLDALDRADEMLTGMLEGYVIVEDVLGAASTYDVAAIEQAGEDLDVHLPELTAKIEDYRTASAACRGAA